MHSSRASLTLATPPAYWWRGAHTTLSGAQDHADVEAINKKVAKDSTGQKDVKLLPYKITGNTGKPMIQVTVKGEVSLRTIDNEVSEVVATEGDTHLAGEDFDQGRRQDF